MLPLVRSSLLFRLWHQSTFTTYSAKHVDMPAKIPGRGCQHHPFPFYTDTVASDTHRQNAIRSMRETHYDSTPRQLPEGCDLDKT